MTSEVASESEMVCCDILRRQFAKCIEAAGVVSSSSISVSDRERLRNLCSTVTDDLGDLGVGERSIGVVGLFRTDKSDVVSSIQLGMNGLFLMGLFVSCSSVKIVGHEVISFVLAVNSSSFSGMVKELLANGFVQVLGPLEISAAALDRFMGIEVPAGLENCRLATGRGIAVLCWLRAFEVMVPRLSKL